MESYNLFYDDFRHPQDAFNIWKDTDFLKLDWIVVRSHNEFKEAIENNLKDDKWPSIISFDHDIVDEHYDMDFSDMNYHKTTHPTGYHTAIWLVEFCKENELDLPAFKVHSQSPSGKRNIIKVLEGFAKK